MACFIDFRVQFVYNSVEAVNEESQWSVASLSPHLCTCKEQNVILGHEGNTDSWTLWLLKKNCLIKTGKLDKGKLLNFYYNERSETINNYW